SRRARRGSRSPVTRRSPMAPSSPSSARASNSKATKWTNGLRNMRIRLKGINSITKTLADGTPRTYWYAWKGGPPLSGEPGTPEFIASYNAAAARKVVLPRGMLLSVMQAYQTSAEFLGLAEVTRKGYVWHIKRIESEFGDFPLAGLTDRRTRGIFMAWRDRVAAGSGR